MTKRLDIMVGGEEIELASQGRSEDTRVSHGASIAGPTSAAVGSTSIATIGGMGDQRGVEGGSSREGYNPNTSLEANTSGSLSEMRAEEADADEGDMFFVNFEREGGLGASGPEVSSP
ncbi:hypothetical protein AAMO2058_001516500 [Amorphochlora amoebiformis]